MKILPNNVAVIDGDQAHAVWCATEGLVHDRFTARLLQNLLLSNHRWFDIVDVGANIGTLTQLFLEAGKFVVAFEPNPKAAECLRHNCGWAKERLTVMNMALGDKEGFVQLNVDQANAGASWVSPAPVLVGVPIATLDLAIQNFESPFSGVDFIKVDIEGCELKFLAGAERVIKTYRPAMLIEANDGALRRQGGSTVELVRALQDLDYITSIAQPDCSWDSPQFDILCMPKS